MLHDDPFGNAVVHWWVPRLQFGAAVVQSALLVHAVRHAVCAALQLSANGQEVGEAAPHVPVPLHSRAGVSTPPLQVSAAQLTVGAANMHAAFEAVVSVHC